MGRGSEFWLIQDDEAVAIRQPRPDSCRTCIFRSCLVNGHLLDRADTYHCEIYEEPEHKPEDVYWEGANCENYQEATDKPQSLLLGLAIGDALGVPVEFQQRGSYKVQGMTGHGTHNQPAGTWSDDTSLALALAESMELNGVDFSNIAASFISWRDGKMYTPHGKVFDIGNATAKAIDRLKLGIEPEKAGGRNGNDNGNGSLMRIAPLALYLYDKNPKERYELTKRVSSITHAHSIAVTACFIYIEMLILLYKGRSRKAAYVELKTDFAYHKKFLDADALAKFDRILKGDIAALPEADIKSSGYVVDTLEAALWSFLTTSNYHDAVLRAVNLGDDTDTVGAVTGAMAGLHYGLKKIPQEWLDKLVKREEIREIAIKMPRWDLIPTAWE